MADEGGDMVFVELGDADRLSLDHVDLQGVNYSGLRMPLFVLNGSRLRGCRFEDLRIDGGSLGAGMQTSVYEECSFDRSRLRNVDTGRARFVGCSFRDVDIADWLCGETEFVGCLFSGTIMDGFFSAKVLYDEGLGRSTNEYLDNDFTNAKLINMDFRGGVDLSRQRLPTGAEYVYVEEPLKVLPRVHAQLEKHSDPEVRETAISYLEIMLEDVENGQRQLLFGPHDLRPSNADTYRAELLLRQLLKEAVEAS